MDRTREPGKKKEGNRPRAWTASAVLAVFLAGYPLLNGCNGLQKMTGGTPAPKTAGDPLVGADPAQKAAPATATAPTRSKSSALPALPASNSSSSNVAMVVGEPLPGTRLLAIEDGTKNSGTWQGQGPPPGTGATLTNGLTPSAGGGGVQLNRPEAIVEPVQRPTPVPLPAASAVGPASNAAMDTAQLEAQLKMRGVTLSRQDKVAEGVKFTCAVPNRHNPDINRFYEATASDYASAVRAVLQQIDAQQNANQ